MTDKYCKDCKNFISPRSCFRSVKANLVTGDQEGITLDAALERIGEPGCGQSGKYFEPKGDNQILNGRFVQIIYVENEALKDENKRLKAKCQEMDKQLNKQNAQIVEVMNERDRWKQGEQALSSRYEALKDENKRLKAKCQGPQPTWPRLFPEGSIRGYTLEMARDEIRWLRTQLRVKEEEIRMWRETVARARQDERRKCWETVRSMFVAFNSTGDTAIRCAANAIRPDGEEEI